MSRSLTRLQALVLGVVVILGLVLAGLGLFSVGSQQLLWSKTFRIGVGFRQIHGVEVGTRVRILGRNAGEVAEVKLPQTPSGEVMLWLCLDKELQPLVRADATAQIVAEGMVGGKVVEISPGTDKAAAIQDGDLIASRPTVELTDVVAQVGGALQGIGNGQGSLGKLVKEDEAYQELLKLLRQGRGTMASLKQNADAIKGMPLVRNYVQDAQKELVRPDCERNRRWFPEVDLFDPGQAVLTSQGRTRLDDLAPWLLGLKHKGSEVVVVSYAHPDVDPELAMTVTRKQSEAVCDYLTNQHAIQKMGFFSRRKVTALGLGTEPPPVPEKDKLPLPRIEVLVFVPQG